MLRLIILLMPLIYMGSIWYLSGRPFDSVINLGPRDGLIKENLHFVEFGMLYLLIFMAFSATEKLKARRNLLALIIAVAFSIADELHQQFVPARTSTVLSSVKDLAKDFTGIALFWGLLSHTRAGLIVERVTKRVF